MEIKLFSDLIDALGKAAGSLKVLTNLAKNERDHYRQVLDDTNQLMTTTLTMIILRLGDILRTDDEAKFVQEVRSLSNFSEWYEAERAFRLCASLRTAVRDAEDLGTRLGARISIKDWNALLQQMRCILPGETQLAGYINESFTVMSIRAGQVQAGTQEAKNLWANLEQVRDALKQERERLLRQEVELLDLV